MLIADGAQNVTNITNISVGSFNILVVVKSRMIRKPMNGYIINLLTVIIMSVRLLIVSPSLNPPLSMIE